MDSSSLLLTVETSFLVPGLGAIAQGAATARLLQFALHTALRVQVLFPDGSTKTSTATVEELTRAEEADYVLLLEFLTPTGLPTGTQILLSKEVEN